MSLISKKHLRLVTQSLKNLFNIKIKDSIKNSTADWSQNDASADNYVKNRTHWEETGEETVILPEATIEINTSSQPFANIQIMPFIENHTYVVNWNGEEYSCTAYVTSDGGIAIGNSRLFIFGDNGGVGNGEPFFYISYPDFAVLFPAESGTHTISITTSESIIHKIDSKFLPDDIGVQPDWNESDESSKAYIHNKPDVVLKEEVDQLIQTLQTRLVLKDNNTGYKYKLYMQDGNLTSDMIGDIQDFTYTTNSDGEHTIIGWNQTLYGNPSTEMIIPDDVIL